MSLYELFLQNDPARENQGFCKGGRQDISRLFLKTNKTRFLINLWLKLRNHIFVAQSSTLVEFDKAGKSQEVPSSLNHSMNPEKWELSFLEFREWQFLAVRTTFWPKIQETDQPFPLPNAHSARTSTCQTLHFNSHAQRM